ncbi:MAG: branched-chain amino acid aminotransferase [Gemmatimonadetes bacterium]|nr:branched-chain amino acid aminotransferase [Gemmatimonadota bacterium]
MSDHSTHAHQSASSICYYQGRWQVGPVPLMTSESNAAWLGNTVFDGARAFEGVAPDLDLHCQRVVRSAAGLNLRPGLTAGEILALAREGIAQFPPDAALYVRPMFWAETGALAPNPDSTQFALVIMPLPLGDPIKGFTACLSPFRRPGPEQAPTHAKAACLYPLAGMAVAEANRRGFDNALTCDPIGNVAEFSAQNVMIGKDGVCHTPVPNGTFLNGITRQRVIRLLRDAGVEVVERTIRPAEVLEADEIFSTGNHSKVLPCLKYESRVLEAGPIYRRARELYWAFAHAGRVESAVAA